MFNDRIDTIQQSYALNKLFFAPDALPIWELAAQISAQVPDDEWQKLPTDLARKYRHYQK